MTITPVARVRTCFDEKFAAPRQPGLCPSAWGELRFEPGYDYPEAVKGLEGFSHLWLLFGFHLTAERGWTPTVRPPRLGGNERVGVFASRSTHRPNGLGLSLVRLEGIEWSDGRPWLRLGGVDLVSGTQIYDVKPYIPFVESLPGARGGYAEEKPPRLEVVGLEWLAGWRERDRALVIEALSLDPRPAAGRAEEDRVHGAGLCGRNVRFRVWGGRVEIVGVDR